MFIYIVFVDASLYAYIHVFWLFFETAQKKIEATKNKIEDEVFLFSKGGMGYVFFAKIKPMRILHGLMSYFLSRVNITFKNGFTIEKLPQTSNSIREEGENRLSFMVNLCGV